MATSNQKPLPSIPRRTEAPRNSTTLTVEGREHLRKLIRITLAEEDQPFPSDGGKDTWANALESALDRLGDNIARGGWLTGAKRARMARKAKRAEELKKSEAKKAKKEIEDVNKLKAKGKVDASEPPPRREDKELPQNPPNNVTTEKQTDISLALRQIRDLVTQPVQPAQKQYADHLLLCLVPIGRPIPSEDSGFDLVPHNTDCTFTPAFFSLPEDISDSGESGILFGLDEWDANVLPLDDDSMRVVGGSFVFKGVTSPTEHNTLSKVLRIAIYVYLTLILEQQLLYDSNVAVKLSKARVNPSNLPYPIRLSVEATPPPSDVTKKPRSSLLPSSIRSFFSKKTESLFQRTAGLTPNLGRTISLDLRPSGSLPLSSEDSKLGRLRRLSFLHESRSPITQSPLKDANAASETPFASTLEQLEKSRTILSSSPGVSLAPPSLIVALAAKESQKPSIYFSANETVGLKSILGWEGIKSQGRGMTGILGFLRHQEFSVLHSRLVPSTLPPQSSDLLLSSSSQDSSSMQNPPMPIFTTCEKARWITYKYYSRDSGSDKTLGDAITDLCSSADKPCNKPGCQSKRGEHELRFIHGGLRIVLKAQPVEIKGGISQDDAIEMWETCKTCAAQSRQKPMSDGTYLYSFAKFLELLCYSPAICTLTPSLCEHTTPPLQANSSSPLPRSRLEIIRHFSYKSYFVSISLSAVDDIFELRFPRLQFLPTNSAPKSSVTHSELNSVARGSRVGDVGVDAEKKVLRREINSWWQGVAEHIDKLEDFLTKDHPGSFSKSLPRLPSIEDDYDSIDTPIVLTPKARVSDLPSQSASIPATPLSSSGPTLVSGSIPNSGLPTSKVQVSAPEILDAPTDHSKSLQHDDASSLTGPPPPIPKKDRDGTDVDDLHCLQNLRHSFQRTEQSLYALLSRTAISSLNVVRVSFLSAARGATRRLLAWQKKHLPKGQLIIGDLSVQEPEWWNKNCHVIAAGGNVIVREDDWGSLIAFTLCSADYKGELAGMSLGKTTSSVPSVPPVASPSASTKESYFFSRNAAYKLFSSYSATPDPDQEDIIWHEPETFSAVISRFEPRDHASLLSLRDVLRHRVSADGPNGLSSQIVGVDSSRSRNASGVTSPSAWAKSAVEVGNCTVGAEISGLPETESVGQLLQETETVSTESSHVNSASGSEILKSQLVEEHSRGQASSLLSGNSDSTIGLTNGGIVEPPEPPPKDTEHSSPPAETNSLFTNSFTNAVRYMLGTGGIPRSVSPSFKNERDLQLPDSFHIDERPHIKYDWMISKRLKFSCTVYYAKQFESLRHRCGIEDVFLRSLGRSANWAAEGGKSKSNFWKTSDDRFIIKTLVNAWNVTDLSVLIDLAPSYFRHMETTTGEPTVIAKLLGFYTVEIKNLESGNTQVKADLLLMENLFYDQKINKTFDLKGIHGRKVKATSKGIGQEPKNKTLFDGEWIEGQQRTLMLVRPHSKITLREAIKNDSNFLCTSNIMDYSLLLGIDEAQKRISCGLVDTIGSYTFAKTLEYKAKQGLNSGKDVTVIPPNEYQQRFVKALDGYFLACPDKWSQPLDNAKVITDAKMLPCVI